MAVIRDQFLHVPQKDCKIIVYINNDYTIKVDYRQFRFKFNFVKLTSENLIRLTVFSLPVGVIGHFWGTLKGEGVELS